MGILLLGLLTISLRHYWGVSRWCNFGGVTIGGKASCQGILYNSILCHHSEKAVTKCNQLKSGLIVTLSNLKPLLLCTKLKFLISS